MFACPSVPDPSARRSLRAWVEQLESTLFPLGWDQPPLVAGIVEGAVDLCIPPARHEDPIEDLLGFAAPQAWSAMGVVTSGQVRELRDDGGRLYGVRTERARRGRCGHFVGRDGSTVSYLRLGDDPPSFRAGPALGRVDDVCRRGLGIPTPPPEVPLAVFWSSRWLQRILVRADAPGAPLTWLRAAAEHPAASLAEERGDALGVEALVAAGRELDEMGTWETVRRFTARGGDAFEGVDPAAAAWMDEGMFARWVLQDIPPLRILRGAVAEIVPGEVAVAIDETLDGWGIELVAGVPCPPDDERTTDD